MLTTVAIFTTCDFSQWCICSFLAHLFREVEETATQRLVAVGEWSVAYKILGCDVGPSLYQSKRKLVVASTTSKME